MVFPEDQVLKARVVRNPARGHCKAEGRSLPREAVQSGQLLRDLENERVLGKLNGLLWFGFGA